MSRTRMIHWTDRSDETPLSNVVKYVYCGVPIERDKEYLVYSIVIPDLDRYDVVKELRGGWTTLERLHTAIDNFLLHSDGAPEAVFVEKNPKPKRGRPFTYKPTITDLLQKEVEPIPESEVVER
jgi:hypothetical protein